MFFKLSRIQKRLFRQGREYLSQPIMSKRDTATFEKVHQYVRQFERVDRPRTLSNSGKYYFSGKTYNDVASFKDFRKSLEIEPKTFTIVGANQAKFVKLGEAARITSGQLVYCRMIVLDVYQNGELQGRLFFHYEHPGRVSTLKGNIDSALSDVNLDTAEFSVNTIYQGPSSYASEDPLLGAEGYPKYLQDEEVQKILKEKFDISKPDATKLISIWSEETNFGEGGSFLRPILQYTSSNLTAHYIMNENGELYRVGTFKDSFFPKVE